MTLRATFHYAALVEGVVDGDTLDVILDLGMRVYVRTRLRLAHVNAPEKNTADGKAARAYVSDLLDTHGLSVTVSTAKPDKYGRALADVQLADGTDLAHRLLDAGFATPYEGGKR